MKRSKFSLSHYKLLSCDMGELVPLGCVEVLPGDSVQHATNALIRCSPLLSPVMHPVHVRIHHWFVPHRLTWEDWEDFITGGPDGMDVSDFPTITMPGGGGAAIGSLADYLGVPTAVNSLEVSALPFRAYALIWNEWYRDQDLETELTVDLTSGADTTTNTALQQACWEKDYFTSARPWEQKGPAVTIPLGTSAPVASSTINITGDGGSPRNIGAQQSTNGGVYAQGYTGSAQTATIIGTADLSGATAANVNLLREAFAIERYEEARARYGSRYTEYLRYLGVRSSDARLQRPEFLGGGRQTVQFSEVLQTAEGTNPVGELRGHGIAATRTNRYRRYFEEHGYIISLLTVRPKTIYAQGLSRHWNRRTKEDFWQQELQHIGQQEIANKEVFAAHPSPDGTFGFQDRYDEYRRQESQIAGEFRTLLDFWHFARQFGSSPALNADFVKCIPSEEPFAVPSQDTLYVMANHNMQARRLVANVGKSFIY